MKFNLLSIPTPQKSGDVLLPLHNAGWDAAAVKSNRPTLEGIRENQGRELVKGYSATNHCLSDTYRK